MNKSTPWKIILSEDAKKDLKSIDFPIQKRIYAFLKDKISKLPDPRTVGDPLSHKLKGLWRYKVAKDYRIMCEIHDAEVLILVIHIKHRKEAYKIH